jgi:hypothetical protein
MPKKSEIKLALGCALNYLQMVKSEPVMTLWLANKFHD